MAFTANIEVDTEFELDCGYEKVFDLLADVPASVSHFPNMDQLVDMGGGKYRWEMKKIGVDKYAIQTVYACKYTSNRDKGWIKWTPVKGEGNGLVKGQWKIEELEDGRTNVNLQTSGELSIPLPKLAKVVVAPIVRREFEKMIDQYIDNLAATLEKKTKKRERK